MARSWQELTKITGGAQLVVERVRMIDSEIAIEGSFELPTVACLAQEDLVFITAFIRSHGSIKQMEQWFGVSYPTIKNRLNRIGEKLEFVDLNPPEDRGGDDPGFVDLDAPEQRSNVLTRLARGEISAKDALEILEREEEIREEDRHE